LKAQRRGVIGLGIIQFILGLFGISPLEVCIKINGVHLDRFIKINYCLIKLPG
jgi:hypothetical protein